LYKLLAKEFITVMSTTKRVSFTPIKYKEAKLSKGYNSKATFASEPGFKRYYMFMLILTVAAAHCAFPSFKFQFVHFAHCVATLSLFHWNKGNEDPHSDGEFDNMTFWEQIDSGRQWTSSRKFLLTIPIILAWAAMYECEWNQKSTILHFVICAFFEVLPKLPIMMGVRLFGINY